MPQFGQINLVRFSPTLLDWEIELVEQTLQHSKRLYVHDESVHSVLLKGLTDAYSAFSMNLANGSRHACRLTVNLFNSSREQETPDLPKLKQPKGHDPSFMIRMCVKSRMEALRELRERCAAFMPLQGDICEGIQIVPMLLDVPTLRRNKFRDPRFIVTRCAKSPKEVTKELCLDFGRAALPRCFDIKAVRQHSPTRKAFMGTRRVIFRKETTDELRERCAAFMPLQCDICEGIRVASMLLDVLTLRRNKFRDPVQDRISNPNLGGFPSL